MSIQNPPKMGNTLFLMHREVIVIKVIKVYTLFRLAMVRYLDEMKEFCVDVCALSSQELINIINGLDASSHHTIQIEGKAFKAL